MSLVNKIKTCIATIAIGCLVYSSALALTRITYLKKHLKEYTGKMIDVEGYVVSVGYEIHVIPPRYENYLTRFGWITVVSGGEKDYLSIRLSDKKDYDEKLDESLLCLETGDNRELLSMLESYARELKEKGEKLRVKGRFDGIKLDPDFIFLEGRVQYGYIVSTDAYWINFRNELGGLNTMRQKRYGKKWLFHYNRGLGK